MNYHDDYEHLSRTMIARFRKEGRRAFEAMYVTATLEPTPPTKPMKLGSLVHAICEDADAVDGLIKIIPPELLGAHGGKQNVAENTKAAKDFREDNEAKGFYVCKTEDEYDNAIAMAASVADILRELVTSTSVAEKEIRWTDIPTGIKCRCKPDLLTITRHKVLAFDIKTCTDASPSKWQWRAKDAELWLQELHYSAGIASEYDLPVDFYFVVVEDKGVNRAGMYQLDIPDSCKDEYDRTLKTIDRCRRTGNWSEPWERKINRIKLWDKDCISDSIEMESV